jgi:hypothetical protein
MPLYTMIYTAYCILLSSDKLRKGPVQPMNSNEQVKIRWPCKRLQTGQSGPYFQSQIRNDHSEKLRN